jgi:hypothetical protein
VTSAPYALINVVAGLVYVLAMPAVGITTAYVYYDALVRETLAEPAPGELPSELPSSP